MHTLFTIYFFVIGLCFGSFALATAWRIKKKKGFVRERSECEQCHHVLSARDLVPLVSWVVQKGTCRYCHKKISGMLPLAELTGASAFAASYAFWPESFHGVLPIVRFALWCVSLILLLILFFYDLQWFKLPNKVIHPLWVLSALDFVVRYIQYPTIHTLLWSAAAVAVAAGVFMLFYYVSRGAWIGYGDIRLGVAIGVLVGTPALAAAVLFIASLIGIVSVLPSLITRARTMTSKLPFGPLLIVALIIVRLFGQRMIDWYTVHLLLIS